MLVFEKYTIHSKQCAISIENLLIWYGVNSYSSQFVLKSIRTHFGQFVLSFRSIRTHLVKFSQLVLSLVDSYLVWSIRTHTKNMILMIYIILLMIDR